MLELLEDKQKEKEQEETIRPPRKYVVYLLNDDVTTMDFVVFVLQKVFAMSTAQAETLMWRVHQEGKAACGVYSKDIAQTKQQQVMTLASAAEYPLRCTIEAEE